MIAIITCLAIVVIVLVVIGMYQKPKTLKANDELMRLALMRANDKKPD